MNWFVDNWYVVLGISAVVVVLGIVIYKFLGLPTKDQIAKIKEWLLYAVTEAEIELGNGTGQLKLRLVYSWFVDKFPVVAKVVSFSTFSKWVDDALDELRNLLKTNEAVKNYIYDQMTINTYDEYKAVHNGDYVI